MKLLSDEMIQEFKIQLINAEKAETTIDKYLRDIHAFMVWLDGKEVCKECVLRYKRELIEKYAPASVNSMLSSLNAFFDSREWYELRVKSIKIQRKIFSSKEKELTKTEYTRLLEAAKNKKNERLYYLMQTIASTGIRVSEVKYVTCEAVKSGQAVINCKGKIRQVFLPQKLCKMLKNYIRSQKIERGSVFVTKTGRTLDRHAIWKMLKDLCKIAGVSKDKVFPHNFRHLFARTFYSIQKDIVRLADILGHSSVETTRIYTMETGEIHRKQIEKMHMLQ